MEQRREPGPRVTRRRFLGGAAAGLAIAATPALMATPARAARRSTRASFPVSAPPIPGLGYHTTLVADPFDQNIMLAGGDVHGLKRTTNNGELWEQIDTGIWRIGDYGISAIVAHPEVQGTYYVLSGSANGGGVYRTRDRGDTWDLLATGIVTLPNGSGLRGYGRLLALDASAASDVLYAASYRDGLYKSTDGGSSFTVLDFAGRNLTAVVLGPDRPSTVLVGWRVDSTDLTATEGGVELSQDGGATWTTVLEGVPVRDLVVDPSRPDNVYAAALVGGVWRSLDGGATWEQAGTTGLPVTTPAGGPTHFNTISVNPGRPGEVLVGTGEGNLSADYGRVFRSQDGGASWTDLVDSATVHITAEVIIPSGYYLNGSGFATSALVVPSSDPNGIWVSGRSGIWYSGDGGQNWFPRFKGLQGAGNWLGIGVEPSTRRFFTGTADWQLIRSDPAREIFQMLHLTPDFTAGALRALCFDFSAARGLLGSGAKFLGSGNYGAVFVEQADGSWSQTGQGLPVRRVLNLSSAASNPDVVYAALAKTGIFRSTDGAATFTDVSSDLPNPGQMFPQSFIEPPLVVHPQDPDTVYFVEQVTGLFASSDGGQSWTHLAGDVPVSGTPVNGGAPYQGFALDPTQPSRMFLATSAGLFRSTDTGVTWAQVTIPATSGFGPIAVAPGTGTVFASALPDTSEPAGAPGIYVSQDGGLSWAGAYVDGSFGVRNFQHLTIDPTQPDTVYAATGGGVFRLQVR